MTAGGRHEDLRSLLGAWALGTCPRPAAAEIARHLTGCADCAEEAARLTGAAAENCTDEPLDLSGTLRRQVLEHCLARRPAELPIPDWAGPYAAESARLDALLCDLGPAEWHEVAELPWHGGVQRWRPAEVLCHLAAVDGYLSPALGLADPIGYGAGGPAVPPPARVPEQGRPAGVLDRTHALITAVGGDDPDQVRTRWRGQSHALLRAAARAGGGDAPVDYGFAVLPLRDAFLDRAFECWIHGDDIARAVDYPYPPPAPQHLHRLIDLGARMLPQVLAALRGPGAAGPRPRRAGAARGLTRPAGGGVVISRVG
ncbi:maleylpyruvate isomerase N-terminal domain-containing protein, partial [Kitasatospora sp. NPDC059571]|uniref:maleylpyruvate isomerase N-terminal domain-containing protein n=1 Tax=Kitasatospora sp. NPDC059571 TaxID=3346871 RepID=UPI0036BAF884